ncbi:hypothetical protein ACG83_21915 [Frankia sp. R43]|uniref:hypothetical protein n=1 Tax=Frankia sp. R43 TaxID=269536 RepID=UPI0006CA0E42|nr:hypothetical protein [Frankia sp. R43]KPM53380.1 hypothetical protein ACG83_21915 [Frankia sp. R43]
MRVIPVDVTAFTIMLAMGPAAPVMEQDNRGKESQKANADGELMFQVPIVFGSADGPASVVTVKVAGSAPTVQVGAPVVITGLVGRVWEMGSRHGVSFSAKSIKPASGAGSKG